MKAKTNEPNRKPLENGLCIMFGPSPRIIQIYLWITHLQLICINVFYVGYSCFRDLNTLYPEDLIIFNIDLADTDSIMNRKNK